MNHFPTLVEVITLLIEVITSIFPDLEDEDFPNSTDPPDVVFPRFLAAVCIHRQLRVVCIGSALIALKRTGKRGTEKLTQQMGRL